MRILFVAGSAGMIAGALSGTRPARGVQKAAIGRERSPHEPQLSIRPDDVTVLHEGVRFFLDGALVGLWRSLRVQKVISEDGHAVSFGPLRDGSAVLPNESVAGWAERKSQAGLFVLGPIHLAYDTREKRMLVATSEIKSAREDSGLAVLLSPHSVSEIRKLANNPEEGG